MRAAFALLAAAEERVNIAFLTTDASTRIRISADGCYRSRFDAGGPDECIARMQREAWSCIVDRLELKRCCSIERWNKITQRLERGELPSITEANVHAFVAEYAAEAPQMIAEAIREVFDWLRPRGPRANGAGSPAHPDRYQANRVVEIPEKVVFSAIAGRGTVTKGYYSEIERAIQAAGTAGIAETDLFRVRYYRNGNGHLWFKDLDLLRKFNALAGGMNLRPAPEASP